MTILDAIILGLVQGITEFIPISSSGHLVIFQNLLGLPDSHQYITFDILLHVGTLVSVLFFYWADVIELIKSFFGIVGDILKGKVDVKANKRNVLILLIVGTLPMFTVFLYKDKIETIFSSPIFVGCALLVTGGILFMTDRIKEGKYTADNTPYKNALVVGIFQLFAVFPGISRSGSTIFAGVLTGIKKEFAVKFSLLLSIIAILGAAASSIPEIISGEGLAATPFQCGVGMIVAAVSGIIAIKFLVKMLNRGKFKYFAIYCWAVGALTIILSL